jgi:ABC-type Mn2+/Zn2+ transport system ATPase subunit
MSGPLLTLTDASFGYDGRPVVRGASFSVAPGEFIGLVGPNGSGKSTLLRGLLGALPPLTGAVTRSPALGRALGWVPQRDALDALFPMTALDLARLGRALVKPWHARLDAEDEALARSALARVGLEGREDDAFAELSGGQRQRALIARALATEPRLLVLDEPTAGVDPASEEAIISLLAERSRAHGLAVVLVTHHLALLRGRAGRVLAVDGGVVTEQSR